MSGGIEFVLQCAIVCGVLVCVIDMFEWVGVR